MKSSLAWVMVFFAAAVPELLLAAGAPVASPKERQFEFTYRAVIHDLPVDAARVRVWIPVPVSSRYQRVTLKKVSGPVRLRETRETHFGNRMMYGELNHSRKSSLEFTFTYEVTRHEYSEGDYRSLMRYNREEDAPPVGVRRFLLPDRLVPVDGRIGELAQENTRGRQGVVDRAYALYDYVFHALRYDKSGTGWGRGDALWACDAKHGNCTDFHSLFIALARAEKIPARFEIGFPLPENAHEGAIPGYHCWAEFYVDGPGWVPVDISEAWQNPDRHDYFFGTIDANRVGFSLGRDLTLSPSQDGPPLNYFVYPYVEVDGQPFDKVEKQFSFRDLATTERVAGQHPTPAR